MKLNRKVIALLAGLSALMTSSAMADSENAAVVVIIDNDICGWATPINDSIGSLKGVLTSAGHWTVTCEGEVVAGDLPEKALVGRSTEDSPLGECVIGSRSTQTWQITVSPSGQSKFTCHGEDE